MEITRDSVWEALFSPEDLLLDSEKVRSAYHFNIIALRETCSKAEEALHDVLIQLDMFGFKENLTEAVLQSVRVWVDDWDNQLQQEIDRRREGLRDITRLGEEMGDYE